MKPTITQTETTLSKCLACRTCGTGLYEFIDFGYMPLAGRFLDIGATHEEIYPMQVSVCPKCSLVQVPNIIAKEQLFNENYHYFSSVTTTLNQHFADYAKFLGSYLSNVDNPLVLEFGCNDGVMLEKLQKYNISHLGVDASANVADFARKRGLNVIHGFFNPDLVPTILNTTLRKPTVVTGSNVFAHNHDVEDILKAVQEVLSPDGYFVVEVHYLLPLIEAFQFDFFYHEHCNYYSVHSLQYLLDKFDLEIVEVMPLSIHGGSIRVISQFKNKAVVKYSVNQFLEKEKQAGLHQTETYRQFAKNVAQFKQDINQLIGEKKAESKRIFGYGASGRAVTLLNYMGTGHLFDFMVDDSPSRAGHIFPGNHLPIYLPDQVMIENTDLCVITAWSYSKEIRQKMPYYLNGQREFIIPLPTIEVIR